MLGLIEHLYNKKAIAYAMTPEMNLLIPEVGSGNSFKMLINRHSTLGIVGIL